MKCGDFDKRNKKYFETFSKTSYFQKLIFNESHDDNINLEGEDKIIFDVGAHRGESVTLFNQIFPLAQIYSFEPIPKMANLIRKLRIKNNIVTECALSNFDGKKNFYIQNITHLSSLHKINENSRDSLGYHLEETHETTLVDVMRGDTFMVDNDIRVVDLLKMDVQASEVQAVEGFSKMIKYVKVIFVEVSFYDLYRTKSSIKSLEAQLPNFELFDIFEISKNPKTMGIDWATLVYKNMAFGN